MSVSSATLRVYVNAASSPTGRDFQGEWYSWVPTAQTSDWSSTASGTAFSVPIAGITTASINDIPLTDAPTQINTSGYTGLRLHISGGDIVGTNENNHVTLESLDYSVAENHAVLIVEYSEGDPPLEPGLLTNTQAFYAPASVAGAVSRTAGLLSNTHTFYEPLLLAHQAISDIGLLVNSQTFLDAAPVPGEATVTPGVLANSQTFFAPDVFYPPQTISDVVLLTSTPSLFGATFVPGTVTRAPALLVNSQDFPDHTYVPGGISVSVGLLTNTSALYDPNLIYGLPYRIHIVGTLVTINVYGGCPTINVTGDCPVIDVSGSLP